MTRRRAGEAPWPGSADHHRPRRGRRPRRHAGVEQLARSSASTSRAGSPSSSRPRATRPSDSIDKAKEIIRQRIDGLGVAEPEVTRQGDNVVVELPGVKDRKKAQQIVGQTAKLQFRPVLDVRAPGGLTRTGRRDPAGTGAATADLRDHGTSDADHHAPTPPRRSTTTDHRRRRGTGSSTTGDDRDGTDRPPPCSDRRPPPADRGAPPPPTTTTHRRRPTEAGGAEVAPHRTRRGRTGGRASGRPGGLRGQQPQPSQGRARHHHRPWKVARRHQGQREGDGQRAVQRLLRRHPPTCPTEAGRPSSSTAGCSLVPPSRARTWPTNDVPDHR